MAKTERTVKRKKGRYARTKAGPSARKHQGRASRSGGRLTRPLSIKVTSCYTTNMKVVFIKRFFAAGLARVRSGWNQLDRNKLGLVSLIGLLFAVIGCASKPALPSANTAASPDPAHSANAFGVLVMAHGGSPEWNQAVLDIVKGLKKYEVEVAFGMADATAMQEAVKKLEARNVRKIGVVRLFVSGESWYERTEQIFGLRPGAPAASTTPPPADPHAHHGAHEHAMALFRVATNASFALSKEGLADAEGMGTVLADRAAALSKSPTREDVLILAHGPGDDAENARWLAKLDARAGAVRSRLPFRRVQVETLREDWPEKRVAAEARIRAFAERAIAEGGKAIVIPYRVHGFGPYAKVLEGIDYTSDSSGLIPHPEVLKWIEQQIAQLESSAFRTPRAN